MNIFDRLDEWVNSTEGSLVNFLTAFAPWLAPLAPAYMTFQHMDKFLDFPLLISIALALLVEILGFGTVSTALDFWFHNRKEKAGVKKAPLEIVIGVFVFYLLLILVSNVVIDVSVAYMTENWQKAAIIVVRALLTLQTIPGALIVAVRTGHRGLLQEIKREKDEKLSGNFPKLSDKHEENKENFPKDWRKFRPTLSFQQVVDLSVLTKPQIVEIAKKHQVDEKTVTNWKVYAQKEVSDAQIRQNDSN
jgi:hypothetical protein